MTAPSLPFEIAKPVPLTSSSPAVVKIRTTPFRARSTAFGVPAANTTPAQVRRIAAAATAAASRSRAPVALFFILLPPLA